VLIYLLKSNGDVADMVRAGEETLIFPDQLPKKWKGKTSIVTEMQSDRRQRLLAGAETGLVHTRFTIYCIDRNRTKSRLLAQVVRSALHNQSGHVAGVTVRQTFVPDGERDESAPSVDGDETPERARALDCIVHYLGDATAGSANGSTTSAFGYFGQYFGGGT